MGQKKMDVNYRVTMALLIVMAGIAIIGISAAMEPFTSYNFNVIDEASEVMLLKIYQILKLTRMALVTMLLIFAAVKSFLFVKAKKAQEMF